MASDSTKAFMEHMDEVGASVQLIDEGDENDVLKTSYQMSNASLTVLMFITKGKYLNIQGRDYIRVPMAKLREVIDVCNKLNNEYRWVKFVCDEEKLNVVIKADHIISTETAAEYISDMMYRMLDIADEAYPEFMKEIWGASDAENIFAS